MSEQAPPMPDDDKPENICRLSFFKLELVDEFITFEPGKLSKPIRDKKIFPDTPEKEPKHFASIRGKAVQSFNAWRPLAYKGKKINLGGADITFYGSGEKYPENDIDIPENLSFKRSDLAIQITDKTFEGLIDRIRENKFHEMEVLCGISLHDVNDRKVLRLIVRKVWLRSAFPVFQRKSMIWSIVGLLIITVLMARLL